MRSHSASAFPRGTLLVNVSGSFVMGALVGLAVSEHLSTGAWATLTVGFCGGFTTFSTATFETLQLAGGERPTAALGYAVGTLAAALAAAAAGCAATSHW